MEWVGRLFADDGLRLWWIAGLGLAATWVVVASAVNHGMRRAMRWQARQQQRRRA